MSAPSEELVNPDPTNDAVNAPESALDVSGAESIADAPSALQEPSSTEGIAVVEETSPTMGAPENIGGFPYDTAGVSQVADTAAIVAPEPSAQEAAPALASQEPEEEIDPMAAAMEAPMRSGSKNGEFNDFESSLAEPAEGDVVTGVVVHKDRDGALLVDIGAKSEGLVRPNEVSRGTEEGEVEPKVGDTIKVVVIGRDKEDGKLLLSKKRADFERAWDKVEEALTDQRVIHAMVTERVKGGLVVDLGIRGFVPASHVGTGDFKHTNLDKYVGQSIALKVIEVDREKRKVILSNKDATREERSRKKADTVASLAEGQVREGTVRRVTDYGAFVDLGGIDGLLHVSEMSWARINHPSDVVKVGDVIQVMILKMRPDQERISLGLRQILPDPWTDVPGKYHVGDKLKVVVSRLVPFGAFVTLDGGIEAIIPNSELAMRRISKPQDVVNAGDEVDALVIELKPDERKMTLSVRRIQEQERREQDTAAREAEYQQFRTSGGAERGERAPDRDRPPARADRAYDRPIDTGADRGYDRGPEPSGDRGGKSKRREGGPGGGGGGGDFSQSGGRVTLGDVFGEQFARARKEVSKKGRKSDTNEYDEAANDSDIDGDLDLDTETGIETEAEPETGIQAEAEPELATEATTSPEPEVPADAEVAPEAGTEEEA